MDDLTEEELRQIVGGTPSTPAWAPLASQISQQWKQYGINPDIRGINRANELAQILANYGITDLSKIGIKETPYEELVNLGYGGENAVDDWQTVTRNRGQLTYGDQTFGRLGGFGSKGQQEFSAPQEYLQQSDPGRYGLGYSAAGKGWTEFEAVKDASGKTVIVPRWGSTSDLTPELVQFLAMAAAPFTGWASTALISAGVAPALAPILTQAAISGTLGGAGNVAQGTGSFGSGFARGAGAGALGAVAAPYIGQLGSEASKLVGGGNFGDIVSGAVTGAGRGAVGAVITGDSVLDAILTGAAGGAASAGTDLLVKGTNSTLGQYLKDVPGPIKNAVLSAASAGILGKDIDKAVVNSFMRDLQGQIKATGKAALKSGQAASAGYGGADIGDFFDSEEAQAVQDDIASLLTRYPESVATDVSLFPEFDQPLLTQEPTNWAELYAQPTTNPVTGETTVGADQSGYPAQNFGVEPQSDINAVYDSIVKDRGGFASTWQTVGSDRIMVQDDGSAIGLNTETGETYGLTADQTQRMVDAGLLNTTASGYDAAIGRTSTDGKKTTPGKAADKKGPGIDALLAALAAMNQRPEKEEDYRVANIQPLGYELMYGLRG